MRVLSFRPSRPQDFRVCRTKHIFIDGYPSFGIAYLGARKVVSVTFGLQIKWLASWCALWRCAKILPRYFLKAVPEINAMWSYRSGGTYISDCRFVWIIWARVIDLVLYEFQNWVLEHEESVLEKVERSNRCIGLYLVSTVRQKKSPLHSLWHVEDPPLFG